MRPIELTLKDFRSFRGEHSFSFAGRRLVAVAGPIGAGKTSILDAIAFALYAQTPKLGNRPAALINQEASEMAVRLRFKVGQESWEVERLARRRGAGTAALYPFSDQDGRNHHDLVGGVRNVNTRVEELLGMDFAAFSRSILLPQGEFAQFLQASTTEKDRVLKGVFGLERIDRMRLLARERALVVGMETKQASDDLDVAESASEELELLRPRLEIAIERAAAVGDLQSRASELDAGSRKVASELESSRSATQALARSAERLRPEREISALVAAANAAAEKNRDAADEVRSARKRMELTETELEQFLTDTGGETGLDLARLAVSELGAREVQSTESAALLEKAERILVSSRRRSRELDRELDKANAVASARNRTLMRARRDLDIARARVDELERSDMAMTLREHLGPEENCPVCGCPIGELPEGHTHPDLGAARRDAQEATAAVSRATDALAEAREKAAALDATQNAAASQAAVDERDRDLARENAEASASRLDRAKKVAVDRLSSDEPATALTRLERRIAQLRRSTTESGIRFAEAVATENRVRAAGESAERQARTLELELTEIAGEMGIRLDSRESSDRDIASLALKLRDYARARARDLTRERCRIKERVSALSEERRKLLAEWDLPDDCDVNDFAARIHAEAATLHADEQELVKKAADAPELRHKKRELERRHRHLGRLVEDLRDSRFLKFMLAGKRAQLAELGGQRIRELTSGRFGFSPGDRFEVVDFGAADPELRTRGSDTLSGGETFLASLSLALALADLVAGQGGRLGSFFLDEGFGSLDADHLEIAMDGIERLASEAEERLVVVVSHVPAVQERVEDQIILSTAGSPGGGSRILSGAAPA